MIAAMSLHLDWRLASIACLFDCWLPVEPEPLVPRRRDKCSSRAFLTMLVGLLILSGNRRRICSIALQIIETEASKSSTDV